jgi:hypothetical protein
MVMGQNPGAQMVPTVIAGIAGEVCTPKYDHYSGCPSPFAKLVKSSLQFQTWVYEG